MITKPGILLIDEAPFMFREMKQFLINKDFDIYEIKNFSDAQMLIHEEKIHVIIYSKAKQNPNQQLFESILKYDSALPSILLDTTQEYNYPLNPNGSDHIILQHLGSRETFAHILDRLIKKSFLKKELRRREMMGDHIRNLQHRVVGKNKAEAYKILMEFLGQELKAPKGTCWFYQKSLESNNRDQTKLEKRIVSWNENNTSEIFRVTEKFPVEKSTAESVVVDGSYVYFPVLSHSGDRNLCFFAFKDAKSFHAENERYFQLIHKEICHIIKIQEKMYEIEELSFVDEVTGLYNQRYLHLVLDQEIERVKRENTKFSVLFIDIDHFKNVNDKNGHLVGSQVLKEIGKILKQNVRSVDYCFRYGGDEFLLVLSGANTDQSTIVAERIRKQIDSTDFVIDGTKVHVTLSIGIACFPDHAKSKKKIIQVADEAMYCGKNLTRNIVYVAS